MTDTTTNTTVTNGGNGDPLGIAGGIKTDALKTEAAPSAKPHASNKGTGDGWFGLLKAKPGANECLPPEEIAIFHKKALSLTSTSNDVAEEFAASIRLAQKIRSRDIFITGAAERLNFIFDCLLDATPRLVLARDARLQLQIEVYRKSGWVSRALARISDGSPVGLVLAALIVSFILWTMLATAVYSLVHYFDIGLASDVFFMNGRALAVISSAAFVGGVISIATRLQEFSRVRDLDPFAMFWTALLKPLIGVVLSFFILATLAGGVISFGFLPQTAFTELEASNNANVAASQTKPLAAGTTETAATIPPGSETAPNILTGNALKALYVLWMLGFLAGFSERFAWDFVSRAEGAVSGPGNGGKGGNGTSSGAGRNASGTSNGAGG